MGPRKRFLAAAALAAVAAVACVNGDASGNQAKEAMENAGLDTRSATCVGNRLERLLEQDQLNEVADQSDLAELAGIPVPGTDDDLYEVTVGTLEDCIDDPGSEAAESDEAEDRDD